MQRLLNWLDHRTGYRHTLDEALYEHIPSGSRWRYVFGSTLVFAFATQVITGLFLWMAYSPSSQTAWESVYYIQYEMQGGWLLRAVHHFMAQAMIVLLAMHLLQVIIDGAYKAPREVNFWLGLILMQIVLGLSLTGYLLPWDQKGYWATSVATNLMTLVPFVGEHLQRLVVGGPEYGHHTLTRFFALHAGILPLTLTGFLALHLALFRKHGLTAIITRGRSDAYFWPDQVLKDAVACLAVMAVVFALAIHFDFRGLTSGALSPHAHGAELGAPADPSEQYSAARPEWYFLFLFQMLKYFPGHLEIIGAIVLPGLVMFILFLMPLIAKVKGGHAFNVAFILLVLGGAAGMTVAALREDWYGPGSKDYAAAVKDAHHSSQRIVELIEHRDPPDGPHQGIPRTGAIDMLRSDPGTRGRKLFERNCLSCHGHDALDAELAAADETYLETRDISAPNLDGFASREWVLNMLNPIGLRSERGFGNTAHRCGRMAEWLETYVPTTRITATDLKDDTKAERLTKRLGIDGTPGAMAKVRAMAEEAAKQRKSVSDQIGEGQLTAAPISFVATCEKTAHELTEKATGEVTEFIFTHQRPELFDIAIALSAQAQLPSQAVADEAAAQNGRLARGLEIIKTTCAKGCHRLGDTGQLGLAPDLTGYGSWEWMMGMMSDPTHRRYYGHENDRMPSYGKSFTDPLKNQLRPQQLSLIADWLRKDYVGSSKDFIGRPHTPQQAMRAWEFARLTEVPQEQVIGQGPPVAATELARAQQLFAQNCAACHNHVDEHGVGIAAKNPSAPNLHGFASRAWIDGLLDPAKFATPHYFGETAHAEGEMSEVVANLARGAPEFPALVAALSAEAQLPAQKELDAKDADLIEKGRAAVSGVFECTNCHEFGEEGIGNAYPKLTGYGSHEWLTGMISNPDNEGFYTDASDRMPAFAGHGGSKARLLSDEDIDLLSKFIRGEPLDASEAETE